MALQTKTNHMESTTEVIDQAAQTTPIQKEKLPNAGGILTMGILSIVFAGGIGIILGIISLSISGTPMRMYRENPEKYLEGSYKNVKAGRTCSIIGISLAGLAIIIIVLLTAAGEL